MQKRANANTTLQPFKGQFRVLGSTAAVDARDNTATTYTATNKGVPIYWVSGAKVADDYEDFYDGSKWDSQVPRNESGNTFPRLQEPAAWTGSRANGTEFIDSNTNTSYALGTSSVVFGQPVRLNPIEFSTRGSSRSQNLYGLSPVITVSTDVIATGIEITSSPAGATYLAGESIEATVTFSGPGDQVRAGPGNPHPEGGRRRPRGDLHRRLRRHRAGVRVHGGGRRPRHQRRRDRGQPAVGAGRLRPAGQGRQGRQPGSRCPAGPGQAPGGAPDRRASPCRRTGR